MNLTLYKYILSLFYFLLNNSRTLWYKDGKLKTEMANSMTEEDNISVDTESQDNSIKDSQPVKRGSFVAAVSSSIRQSLTGSFPPSSKASSLSNAAVDLPKKPSVESLDSYEPTKPVKLSIDSDLPSSIQGKMLTNEELSQYPLNLMLFNNDGMDLFVRTYYNKLDDFERLINRYFTAALLFQFDLLCIKQL